MEGVLHHPGCNPSEWATRVTIHTCGMQLMAFVTSLYPAVEAVYFLLFVESQSSCRLQDIINGLAGCLLRAKDDMTSPSGKRLVRWLPDSLEARGRRLQSQQNTDMHRALESGLSSGAVGLCSWS